VEPRALRGVEEIEKHKLLFLFQLCWGGAVRRPFGGSDFFFYDTDDFLTKGIYCRVRIVPLHNVESLPNNDGALEQDENSSSAFETAFGSGVWI